MRICIDIDGVISNLKKDGETYENVQPVSNAVEKIRALKAAGHYIILFTARHMKTCNGNQGLVAARVASVTLEWLERHGIIFDEIYFGKPWADVYIDDNALRFETWDAISSDGGNLPNSTETRMASSIQL